MPVVDRVPFGSVVHCGVYYFGRTDVKLIEEQKKDDKDLEDRCVWLKGSTQRDTMQGGKPSYCKPSCEGFDTNCEYYLTCARLGEKTTDYNSPAVLGGDET